MFIKQPINEEENNQWKTKEKQKEKEESKPTKQIKICIFLIMNFLYNRKNKSSRKEK